MARTITVEGDLNTVDSRTVLTAQGSVTAPSLVVPQGVNKIKGLIAAASHDGAADDGSAVWFVRLGGNSVQNGEQVMMIGAGGNQTVQSGSDAAPNVMMPFVIDDLDIDVRPGDTITIAAEFAGVDIGDTALAVTLIYGK